MGSWCATCGISRMPIKEDQEVKLLLIAKSGLHNSSSCYIDEWWKPIGLPIDVKYADYGNFELIKSEDEVANSLLNFLKKNVKPLEQGENKYHDLEVVPSELDWSKVNELIHETRLMLNETSYYNYNKYLVWFPIHKKVYDSLIKPYYAYGIEMPEYLRTVDSTIENINNVFTSKADVDDVDDTDTINFITEMHRNNELREVFGNDYYIKHFINSDSSDSTIQVAAESIHLRASMSRLRIPFIPVTGMGGQSDLDEYKLHQSLADAIKEQAQDILDYYNELWGDDDE